jgi:hypothetical protein
MNYRLIIYTVAVLLIGMAIGGLGTKTYLDPDYVQANKTIDSLIAVDIERKKNFDKMIMAPQEIINKKRQQIQQRDEEHKRDTTVISDNELIQRARSITGND